MKNKEQRFEELCQQLFATLNSLNEEFPKARVPILRVSPEEVLDVLDYFVNKDAPSEWNMGE